MPLSREASSDTRAFSTFTMPPSYVMSLDAVLLQGPIDPSIFESNCCKPTYAGHMPDGPMAGYCLFEGPFLSSACYLHSSHASLSAFPRLLAQVEAELTMYKMQNGITWSQKDYEGRCVWAALSAYSPV